MLKRAIVVGLVISSMAFAEEEQELLHVGVAGAGIGFRDITNSDDDFADKGFAYVLEGKYSLPILDMFSLQLDLDYDANASEEDNVESQMSGNLHLAYRNPDMFLVGLFGGYAEGSVDGDDDDVSGPLYGVEGQYYLGRWTLYGQFGMAEVDNLNDSDNAFDGYFYTTALRYFPVDDDMMVQLGYEYGKSPDQFEDDNDWGSVDTVSVKCEKRILESQPLYGSVDLAYNRIKANSEDFGTDTSLMFGITYYWGAPSLFDNDRRGATLDSTRLPALGASWANVLD